MCELCLDPIVPQRSPIEGCDHTLCSLILTRFVLAVCGVNGV